MDTNAQHGDYSLYVIVQLKLEVTHILIPVPSRDTPIACQLRGVILPVRDEGILARYPRVWICICDSNTGRRKAVQRFLGYTFWNGVYVQQHVRQLIYPWSECAFNSIDYC